MPTKKPPITILMGPTGSGKSALALAAAQLRPTVIINADAMQMVATLRTITARPTVEEEQAAEHALYGVLPPEYPTSVAVWLSLVEPVIHRAFEEDKMPLLVGGTGMYIKALMEGLAAVPPIPEAIRRQVRSWASEARETDAAETEQHNARGTTAPHSGPSIHDRLRQRDPLMAARLKPGDTQRILRALEVIEATGISLEIWQQQRNKPLFHCKEFRTFYTDIPRLKLYDYINQRFHKMIDRGALDEVRHLMALNLPEDTPILRAHGVPELAAHLRGEQSLESAITKAQQHTRNYAKRQMTWIRNQLPDAIPIPHDLPTPSAATMIFTKA